MPPILPPRPNPGPEPLDEPGRLGLLSLTAILVGLVGVLFVVLLLIRRRRNAKRLLGTNVPSRPSTPPSPRERLIAIAPMIRLTLARVFGPSYVARTTEELADDHRIREALGDDDFATLIEILGAIDRLKFSATIEDVVELGGPPEVWESTAAQLARALEQQGGKTVAPFPANSR
jgi:hypothetical protein